MREAFGGHPFFEDTARFCKIYDQGAFDPAYDKCAAAVFFRADGSARARGTETLDLRWYRGIRLNDEEFPNR